MANRDLESFVEARRQEAVDKQLEEKAHKILDELGKKRALGSEEERKYKQKPLKIFFTKAYEALATRYPDQLDIIYKKEKVFEIQDGEVTCYLPGIGTWEPMIEDLYETAITVRERAQQAVLEQREKEREEELSKNFGYTGKPIKDTGE